LRETGGSARREVAQLSNSGTGQAGGENESGSLHIAVGGVIVSKGETRAGERVRSCRKVHNTIRWE